MMKFRFTLLFIVLGLTLTYAQVNAVVSILPQQTFLKAIGGDKVNVSLMVKPGNSPHTYEPKPSQMKEIENAAIYFTIGVEFETIWLSRFTTQNKQMIIGNMAEGITKMEMEGDHHHEHDHHDADCEKVEENAKDPHIWTTPANVKVIAKNTYETLAKTDPANQSYYQANYEKFLTTIKETDREIQTLLGGTASGKKFMVFHPAWGYFARDYGLEQIAIEVSGKSPKPKQVMQLIQKAKKEKVNAVFTAPEFSEKVAQIIAMEVGVPVVKVSPLNPNWSENLINLAKAIANQ